MCSIMYILFYDLVEIYFVNKFFYYFITFFKKYEAIKCTKQIRV